MVNDKDLEKESGLINSKDLINSVMKFAQDEKGDVETPPDEDDIIEESEISYEEGLEDGISQSSSSLLPNISEVVVKQREDTRSTLAIIYVVATFGLFLLSMFIAVLDGLNRDVSIISNLMEVIPLLSGVFLGTLGFVLGYYFRKSDEDNSPQR